MEHYTKPMNPKNPAVKAFNQGVISIPKTKCSCGRTHTAAIDTVTDHDGNIWFNCLCGSTGMITKERLK